MGVNGCAFGLGAVLVTNKLREFARIERLRLENWVE
jgi:predicted nucleic acid-binding protein